MAAEQAGRMLRLVDGPCGGYLLPAGRSAIVAIDAVDSSGRMHAYSVTGRDADGTLVATPSAVGPRQLSFAWSKKRC